MYELDETQIINLRKLSQAGTSCAKCHKKNCPLQRCSKCSFRSYCSEKCQKAHWPEHKSECREFIGDLSRQQLILFDPNNPFERAIQEFDDSNFNERDFHQFIYTIAHRYFPIVGEEDPAIKTFGRGLLTEAAYAKLNALVIRALIEFCNYRDMTKLCLSSIGSYMREYCEFKDEIMVTVQRIGTLIEAGLVDALFNVIRIHAPLRNIFPYSCWVIIHHLVRVDNSECLKTFGRKDIGGVAITTIRYFNKIETCCLITLEAVAILTQSALHKKRAIPQLYSKELSLQIIVCMKRFPSLLMNTNCCAILEYFTDRYPEAIVDLVALGALGTIVAVIEAFPTDPQLMTSSSKIIVTLCNDGNCRRSRNSHQCIIAGCMALLGSVPHHLDYPETCFYIIQGVRLSAEPMGLFSRIFARPGNGFETLAILFKNHLRNVSCVLQYCILIRSVLSSQEFNWNSDETAEAKAVLEADILPCMLVCLRLHLHPEIAELVMNLIGGLKLALFWIEKKLTEEEAALVRQYMQQHSSIPYVQSEGSAILKELEH